MELYPSFLLLLLACYVQVTFCTPKRGGRSLCGRWPMSATRRCRGKRSVEDQGMQEQDFGIKIDYGTPGPILEPNQDEVIGHDRDENIMESGQDLNRARRSPCRWGCMHRSVEDQDMNQEQDEYIGQEQDTTTMESGQNLNRRSKAQQEMLDAIRKHKYICRGGKGPGCRNKRSVEDQDMDQKQDNVTLILEPHQDEVIGENQDAENIMESGQDLNRRWSMNICSTWCRRCTKSSWWCRSCPRCRRGKRSVGVEDQGMDQEQDAVVSPPGFAYNDLNRIMT